MKQWRRFILCRLLRDYPSRYGIHRKYKGQAARFFPLPDYGVTEPQTVRRTIHRAIVDPDYSRALIQRTEIQRTEHSLADIRLLDRVQKRLPIDEAATKDLSRNNFPISGVIRGNEL